MQQDEGLLQVDRTLPQACITSPSHPRAGVSRFFCFFCLFFFLFFVLFSFLFHSLQGR